MNDEKKETESQFKEKVMDLFNSVEKKINEMHQDLNTLGAETKTKIGFLEKEMETAIKIGQKRRSQIGKAQRAEKIRTYNFPQNRVTDHRIKKSFHNIEEIMEGKLEPLIKAFSETALKE